MTDLIRASKLSLLERTRDLATLSEDELKRLAAEAARDRDAYRKGRLAIHLCGPTPTRRPAHAQNRIGKRFAAI